MDTHDQIINIRSLRLDSSLHAAITLIEPLIKSAAPEVITELVRLTILLNKFDLASKYFQSLLSRGHVHEYCEIELLCRLQIEIPGIVPSRFLSVERQGSISAWVHRYQQSGLDHTYAVIIHNCQVDNRSGWILYRFAIKCPSCDTMHKAQIVGTFLINKIYFCPQCYARLEITFDTIRSFLRAHCPNLFDAKMKSIDTKVASLEHTINSINCEVPTLVSYLNQDYIFILSQMIVSELLRNCSDVVN